jgi:hypothetical protein
MIKWMNIKRPYGPTGPNERISPKASSLLGGPGRASTTSAVFFICFYHHYEFPLKWDTLTNACITQFRATALPHQFSSCSSRCSLSEEHLMGSLLSVYLSVYLSVCLSVYLSGFSLDHSTWMTGGLVFVRGYSTCMAWDDINRRTT